MKERNHNESPNLTDKRRTRSISSIFVIVLLFFPTILFADAKTINFMLLENGRIVKIDIIQKKTPTLSRAFPLWDKPIGLSLVDFETEKEILRLTPDEKKTGILLGAYPLDSERIACNFLDDTTGKRTYNTGVWNIRTKELRLYKGTGSGYADEISGMHPDETKFISCPYVPRGIDFHDLTDKTKKYLFADLHGKSSRFSPDGSRYAFFGDDDNKENYYLIIQLINDSKTYKIEFKKGESKNDRPSGRVLTWSPSGSFIAGIVDHYFVKEKLYIWKSNGELISTIDLPFSTEWGWPPLWLSSEKEIAVFHRNGKSDKISYRIFEIKTGI
ncbi:MAG: hypothetical protein EPN94_02150 [Nitrospirae bacterium]|nr:MAG: hypothetical protein EPN94_02150 [Nitrospirota bacterium]